MEMIWIISSIAEESWPLKTFNDYKKAYDKGVMNIYCAGADCDFSFLRPEDIAIVRTRNKSINNALYIAQKEIGFRSTLEHDETVALTYDKEYLKTLLAKGGIAHPQSLRYDDIKDGNSYFVKPRYGEDSIGVDVFSLCSCVLDVNAKCVSLTESECPYIIEEYIDGPEITTAVIFSPQTNDIEVYSAEVKPRNLLGFHTSEVKKNYAFDARLYSNSEYYEVCRNIFKLINARHHIRIDSRIKDGKPYIIDVNLIPGLNRNGYMSKCMEVNGVGYYDFIRKIVNSAS